MMNLPKRALLTAAKSSAGSTQIQSRSLFGFSNNSGSASSNAKAGWNAAAQGSGKSTGKLRKVGKVMVYEETREMSYVECKLFPRTRSLMVYILVNDGPDTQVYPETALFSDCRCRFLSFFPTVRYHIKSIVRRSSRSFADWSSGEQVDGRKRMAEGSDGM